MIKRQKRMLIVFSCIAWLLIAPLMVIIWVDREFYSVSGAIDHYALVYSLVFLLTLAAAIIGWAVRDFISFIRMWVND